MLHYTYTILMTFIHVNDFYNVISIEAKSEGHTVKQIEKSQLQRTKTGAQSW